LLRAALTPVSGQNDLHQRLLGHRALAADDQVLEDRLRAAVGPRLQAPVAMHDAERAQALDGEHVTRLAGRGRRGWLGRLRGRGGIERPDERARRRKVQKRGEPVAQPPLHARCGRCGLVLGVELVAVVAAGQAQAPGGREDLDLDRVAGGLVRALELCEHVGGLLVAATLEELAGGAECDFVGMRKRGQTVRGPD
jgi:hypothetical protein